MSAVKLTLRAKPDQRLDLSQLTPERLAGLTESEIGALPVNSTKAPLTAGDVFRIEAGDTDALEMQADGAGARFDNIGRGMTRGRLTVEGGAGADAGRGMSGGELTVAGNAGPYAGSGMSGGLIRIQGGAGDFLGGPRSGEMTGMTGGTIIVTGRTGARAGDRMRRGLIAIGGDAGDYLGSRMIAGTVAVFGNCGAGPGILMRRGTVVLGGEAASWTPTFVDSGGGELTWLAMLAMRLRAELPPAHLAPLRGAVRRFAGDMATLGKGEILRLRH